MMQTLMQDTVSQYTISLQSLAASMNAAIAAMDALLRKVWHVRVATEAALTQLTVKTE